MPKTPLFITSDTAGHVDAAMNQQRLYKREIDNIEQERGDLDILDFGCGPTGTGRVFLEGVISNTRHRLSLFDSEADINPTRLPNVDIKDKESVIGPNADFFDIVNISYVLCLLEPDDARDILQSLQEAHPTATFIVIDYILKGRSKQEILGLLNSHKEQEWIEKLGEDEFYRTHSRFSLGDLLKLMEESGMSIHPQDIKHLDCKGYRGVMISRQPIEKPTPLDGLALVAANLADEIH